MKIDFTRFLENIRNCDIRFYDFKSELCYFPYLDEEIDLRILSNKLNTFAEYVTTKETFSERKNICENDEEWKQFIQQLKRDCNYTCQLSHFSMKTIKNLDYKIFGIENGYTWINNWLTPHHIDGSIEYRCFDKTKIRILNRAIHMIEHRYNNLIHHIPELKWNYELWYELGSLIHDRENEYPWRKITQKKR